MKKFFYTLCMSALAFTGCSKPSPSSYMSESGIIVKNFCKENPKEVGCVYLAEKTELSPQEVRSVMKLEKNSTSMLYGASDPTKWTKGYYNLTVTIPYTVNFSLESGSVLKVGMEIEHWKFNATTKKFFGNEIHYVEALEGGNKFFSFGNEHKGKTILLVAVFTTLKKYFFLPPLRFAP